jgi:hypothetical protein
MAKFNNLLNLQVSSSPLGKPGWEYLHILSQANSFW